MSELKPCPFCGGEAITTAFFDADDFDYMPIEVNDCDAEVTCKNERCINGWWLSPKDWNNRPIEDALHARITELEADSVQIQYICEDELPEGISDEVFSAMYPYSKVNFVRMFPFVMVDGDKCFLIKLPEVQE